MIILKYDMPKISKIITAIKKIFTKQFILSTGTLLCLQYVLNHTDYIIKSLHFDTVSIVLTSIIPIYAVTLAYFAIIPKYSLEHLKSNLLKLQQADSNLLQIKEYFDDYKNEYDKIKNIDDAINNVTFLHNISLAISIITAIFFMISAVVVYYYQVQILIVICTLAQYAELCIKKTYKRLSENYPSPSDLLDASKTLTSIGNIDVNLYENLPAYILARGTSIIVKNDFSFIKLENKEKYSNFILIDFALPFNLKNFSLEYTSKNYSLESISLSDKKLLFDRKNPSLEILITKDNELNEYPSLQLSTKRSDDKQEIWPFTPKYPNTYEYIARYPIIIIRKLGKIDMSRYIVH